MVLRACLNIANTALESIVVLFAIRCEFFGLVPQALTRRAHMMVETLTKFTKPINDIFREVGHALMRLPPKLRQGKVRITANFLGPFYCITPRDKYVIGDKWMYQF